MKTLVVNIMDREDDSPAEILGTDLVRVLDNTQPENTKTKLQKAMDCLWENGKGEVITWEDDIFPRIETVCKMNGWEAEEVLPLNVWA